MWLHTFSPPPPLSDIKKEPLNAELSVKGRHGGFKRQFGGLNERGGGAKARQRGCSRSIAPQRSNNK